MGNQKGLPKNWEVVKLGKFVEYQKGKKPKNQSVTENAEYPLPYVDIEAFEQGIIKSWTDGEGCRLCSDTDFLMVWDGSRSGLVGKGLKGALGSTLMRLNFPSMENQYAYYFLLSKYQEINTRAKGSGTPHVDPDLLWNYDFPIPPYAEQNRIVAKIEELFSELDSGIASLKTAREQLKIYRQALLKHAFEGKLTEQWRKDNPDQLETPEQLLAHIQQERETRYQQQLNDWKQAVKDWEAQGKEGKKPSKPTKSSKLQSIANAVDLPWCFVNYEGVCELIRNGVSAKPVGDSGAKIFRISAVRAMSFNLSDIRYINNIDGQYNDFFLKKGDLVFTRYNGTREYVGVCAEYKGDESHLYPDKLILTRLGVQSILPSFLEKAFATGISRSFIEERIRTTAGQSGVSGGDIKSAPIPICSLAEQQEIVNQLEEKLSIVEQNEKEIENTLAKAELLRQSILKKAFSGQLVPQDLSDEPASELLARIKAEKTLKSQQLKTVLNKWSLKND